MSGVRLSRAYMPAMLERNWGRVVFLSSESGLNIPPEMIHYGFTKTAVLAIARGLAKRVAGTGVTVNSVLPGPTFSEGVEDMLKSMGRRCRYDRLIQRAKHVSEEDPVSRRRLRRGLRGHGAVSGAHDGRARGSCGVPRQQKPVKRGDRGSSMVHKILQDPASPPLSWYHRPAGQCCLPPAPRVIWRMRGSVGLTDRRCSAFGHRSAS